MSTRRLEAFSDGVFAIAATLLILNVAVTGLKPLDRELIDIWPSYAAYAIAFLTIGVVWANHHSAFSRLISLKPSRPMNSATRTHRCRSI